MVVVIMGTDLPTLETYLAPLRWGLLLVRGANEPLVDPGSVPQSVPYDRRAGCREQLVQCRLMRALPAGGDCFGASCTHRPRARYVVAKAPAAKGQLMGLKA